MYWILHDINFFFEKAKFTGNTIFAFIGKLKNSLREFIIFYEVEAFLMWIFFLIYVVLIDYNRVKLHMTDMPDNTDNINASYAHVTYFKVL